MHVVQDARQDAAGALLRVKADAQPLQVLEELAPQVGDDAVAEVHVEVAAAVQHGRVQEAGRRRQLGQVDAAARAAPRAAAAAPPAPSPDRPPIR